MRPVLFLDIDGVLNCKSWYASTEYKAYKAKAEEEYKLLRPEDMPIRHLNPSNVEWLNTVCEEHDFDIVISSTWRIFNTYAVIGMLLSAAGFKYSHRIVGATDHPKTTGVNIKDLYVNPPKFGTKINRGMEIEFWLMSNISLEDLGKMSFVILDDLAEFGRLSPVHVRTDEFKGGLHGHGVRKIRSCMDRQSKSPAGLLLARPNKHWNYGVAKKFWPHLRCETCGRI